MPVTGAEAIRGEGALPCIGSIAGGILLGQTLIGAVVAAILIVCCCAGGLDDWFGTTREAPSPA